VWSLAALTHLRLVVINHSKQDSCRIHCDSKVLLHGAEQILMDLDYWQVPHGLRSRSRDTYLHSEVANPHYVALARVMRVSVILTIYIPESIDR
jgi:hypothetical protein